MKTRSVSCWCGLLPIIDMAIWVPMEFSVNTIQQNRLEEDERIMIVVHVEHFLNAEGVAYFPQWIVEAREVLSKFAGFRSIQQLEWVDDPQTSHLWLEFEDLDLLRAWSASAEHDELIARLGAYQVKKQESKIFRMV